MKRDWGFWSFWLAVAGIAVAAGRGLPSLGYPTAGRWLFGGGLVLAAFLVVGVLSKWVARPLAATSASLLRKLQSVALFIVEAVAWLGALLLAPVIRRLLREQGLAEAQTFTWTADKKRGKQGSDFFPIARKGYRVAGARFIVRAEYFFPSWHAGFRLTRANDNLEQSDLRATVLIQMTFDHQPMHTSHREGADWGPWGLRRSDPPMPGHEFDLTVFRSSQAGRLQLVYSIDGDTPQGFDFPEGYAEQIVFVAWADGQDFRVHFEQISVSWTAV